MLSADFGAVIRKERMAKHLSQSELASRANVSRTTLSRLEQGRPRPVQTDVLDRIFQALDCKPNLPAEPAREERLRARLEQQMRLEKQRNRHLHLAIRLAGNPQDARELIRRARDVVSLWRSRKTCSPFYIERWSKLLSLPPAKLAQKLAGLGEWENALFQNTPWSWAWS